MDEEKITLTAILGAYQILLVKLFGMVYALAKLEPSDILKIHEAMREKMPEWNVLKVDDPAISDLISGEIAEAVDQILSLIEKQAGLPPKQSPKID